MGNKMFYISSILIESALSLLSLLILYYAFGLKFIFRLVKQKNFASPFEATLEKKLFDFLITCIVIFFYLSLATVHCHHIQKEDAAVNYLSKQVLS